MGREALGNFKIRQKDSVMTLICKNLMTTEWAIKENIFKLTHRLKQLMADQLNRV